MAGSRVPSVFDFMNDLKRQLGATAVQMSLGRGGELAIRAAWYDAYGDEVAVMRHVDETAVFDGLLEKRPLGGGAGHD